MRAVAYIRVSTSDQASDGVSLDVQREKVRLFAELHGLDLVDVVADAGASAKTMDRPGLSRVLAMLDARDVAGLVVFKLDRLTRNLGDWSHLIDHYFGDRAGGSLMSVSESIDTRTAGGRMVLNIMMTVAQWERETIVERTRGAVAYKKAKGERVGQVPFGRDLGPDGRALVVNQAELDALASIHRWRAAGCTLRQIADRLTAAGVPTKNGSPRWNHTAIAKIINREKARAQDRPSRRPEGGSPQPESAVA